MVACDINARGFKAPLFIATSHSRIEMIDFVFSKRGIDHLLSELQKSITACAEFVGANWTEIAIGGVLAALIVIALVQAIANLNLTRSLSQHLSGTKNPSENSSTGWGREWVGWIRRAAGLFL